MASAPEPRISARQLGWRIGVDLPEARSRIAALARENDCEFRRIDEPAIHHHRFLEETLASAAEAGDGALVFLDPDLCLWENCEDLEFEGLIAGKMVEAHEDPFM